MRKITVHFGISDELYDELVVTAALLHTNVSELFSTVMQTGTEMVAREKLAVLRRAHAQRRKGARP